MDYNLTNELDKLLQDDSKLVDDYLSNEISNFNDDTSSSDYNLFVKKCLSESYNYDTKKFEPSDNFSGHPEDDSLIITPTKLENKDIFKYKTKDFFEHNPTQYIKSNFFENNETNYFIDKVLDFFGDKDEIIPKTAVHNSTNDKGNYFNHVTSYTSANLKPKIDNYKYATPKSLTKEMVDSDSLIIYDEIHNMKSEVPNLTNKYNNPSEPLIIIDDMQSDSQFQEKKNSFQLLEHQKLILKSPLYIPLQYWFNKDPGLAIPFVALPKEKLIELGWKESDFISTVKDKNIKYTIEEIHNGCRHINLPIDILKDSKEDKIIIEI